MERNFAAETAIILNDLNSMAHRIEMLPANPHYTSALLLVQKAWLEIDEGRAEIHRNEMKKRFAGTTSQ
jgi:hypothetical protein